MSNQIIKRMEKAVYNSCSGEKSIRERKTVITCTRQRRLEQMQSELATCGGLTENWNNNNIQTTSPTKATLDNHRAISLRELIAARIAQTEDPNDPSNQPSKDDRNRTLMNLDTLAASIYFWSPYSPGGEDKTSGSMRSNLKGRTCAVKKDIFINFSQPALIMVAQNPETPPHTLKWLAIHHSPEVRKAVAKNGNIDGETMNLLAQDFDSTVQFALLDNTSISKELAVKLASSKNFSISSKARNVYYKLDIKSKQPPAVTKQETCEEDIIQNEREFLKAIADCADTSRRLLVKSSQLTADWHIRMLVAGDPNATAEILWQLASHPVSQVKRKLVDKYNCLLETMVNLKGNKKHGVKNGLAASAAQTLVQLKGLSH